MNQIKDQKLAGGIYALLAFGLWGILPIYWKTLGFLSADEVLSHRILCSAIFLAILVTFKKRWSVIRSAFLDRKVFFALLGSALLISVNWFIYIWAVQENHIVETSLGYYINPLLSVFLGFLVLKERLRSTQWFAVFLALCGVVYQTVVYGQFPWIALSLAMTFGFYGLLKKVSRIDSISSLLVETLFVTPVVLIYLFAMGGNSVGHETPMTFTVLALIAGAGVATSMPLLFFGEAAKRLNLSTVGFFQYLGPSMNLAIGVFMYNEPFTSTHVVTFGLIWGAVAIFAMDNYRASRNQKKIFYKKVMSKKSEVNMMHTKKPC